MKNGLFAVINIGTSAFRMEIGSFINGKYTRLEYLIKSLSLGKDTFSKGYISSKTIKEALIILNNFKHKMIEYGIKGKFAVIATSGVREAKNREFFVDYIYKKTNIKIIILKPHEELYIRYIAIKNEFANFNKMEKKGIALVNVSSGNVSVAIVKTKSIIYADSLHFGSLRLNEIFKDVEEKHKVFAYNRYIDNMLDNIKKTVSNHKIENIVFSGSSINILNKAFQPKINTMRYDDIKRLYDKINKHGFNSIKDLPLRKNEIDVLKPTLSIYLSVLKLFKLDTFSFSKTGFPEKLLMYYSKSFKICNLNNYVEDTILSIGRKYGFDEKHALFVKKNAEKLFDGLQDIHLLDKKYKKILSIAALLHDVGYFINAYTHERHSYYIIRSTHLPQVSENDNKIISLTALLHKAKDIDPYLKLYDYLNEKDMFILMKLAALLRIADALDASHRQLIKDFDTVYDLSGITIKIKSSHFIYFEEVSLKRKARLFEEIFGINIKLEHIIE